MGQRQIGGMTKIGTNLPIAPHPYPGNYRSTVEALLHQMTAGRPECGAKNFVESRPGPSCLLVATVGLLRYQAYAPLAKALGSRLTSSLARGRAATLDVRVACEAAGFAGIVDTVRCLALPGPHEPSPSFWASRIRACLECGLLDEAEKLLGIAELPEIWERFYFGKLSLQRGNLAEAKETLNPIAGTNAETALLYARTAIGSRDFCRRDVLNVLSLVPETMCDRYLLEELVAESPVDRLAARLQYRRWFARDVRAFQYIIGELMRRDR